MISNSYISTLLVDFLQGCSTAERQNAQALTATLLYSLREQKHCLQTRWAGSLAPLENASLDENKKWEGDGIYESRQPQASVSGRGNDGVTQGGSTYKIPGVPTADEGLTR